MSPARPILSLQDISTYNKFLQCPLVTRSNLNLVIHLDLFRVHRTEREEEIRTDSIKSVPKDLYAGGQGWNQGK